MAKKSAKTQDETATPAPKAKATKATATPKAAPTPEEKAKAEAFAALVSAKVVEQADADRATREERRTSAHAEIARLVAAESARRLCLCGCGTTTPRAFFVPGHDSKLMSRLLDGE